MLVGPADLGIANSRALTGVIVWNQLAGPPIGAALFAAGMALPFVSESVCVLAGVLLISQVQLPAHGTRGRHARMRDDNPRGMAGCGRTPRCGRWPSRFSRSNVNLSAPTWSVLVLYARERLGMGALGFGLITTAMAVGGLLGTASYGWLERHIRLGVLLRRADHRDADPPGARPDPLGLVRADRLRDLRRARVYLGNDIVRPWRQRSGARRVPGPRGQCLPHRRGRRHCDRVRARRADRLGVGHHRAVSGSPSPRSALILVVIWRSLLHIAHADEDSRASAPPQRPGADYGASRRCRAARDSAFSRPHPGREQPEQGPEPAFHVSPLDHPHTSLACWLKRVTEDHLAEGQRAFGNPAPPASTAVMVKEPPRLPRCWPSRGYPAQTGRPAARASLLTSHSGQRATSVHIFQTASGSASNVALALE